MGDHRDDPGGQAFPHRTIEDNVATVPLLNGWRRGKARARARYLMQLAGVVGQMAVRPPSTATTAPGGA